MDLDLLDAMLERFGLGSQESDFKWVSKQVHNQRNPQNEWFYI